MSLWCRRRVSQHQQQHLQHNLPNFWVINNHLHKQEPEKSNRLGIKWQCWAIISFESDKNSCLAITWFFRDNQSIFEENFTITYLHFRYITIYLYIYVSLTPTPEKEKIYLCIYARRGLPPCPFCCVHGGCPVSLKMISVMIMLKAK